MPIKVRVLVVDDEPQILRFLKPSLAAAGYEVLVAQSGGEALRLCATAAPDIVVLDLGLPDMEGREVISQIRAWSQVPIVVLSARDRERRKLPCSTWAPTIMSTSRLGSAN